MTDTNNPQPFDSDAEYLDMAFAALVARARRIGAEHQQTEDAHSRVPWDCRSLGRQGTVGDEESRRRIEQELLVEERRLQDHLEGRLAVHRADSSREPLGIDMVCKEANLDEQERMVLLACTALAISPDVAKELSEGLGCGLFSRFGIEAAIRLLDPSGSGDWLKCRALFHRSSRLVSAGLITIEYPSTTFSPGDLLMATIEVTSRAFSVITGTPLDDEGQEGDDSGAGR